MAGSAAAPAVRCRKCRRESFTRSPRRPAQVMDRGGRRRRLSPSNYRNQLKPSPYFGSAHRRQNDANRTPLFAPSCLGVQTRELPSGATTLLILSLGTRSHSPSTLTSLMVTDLAALRRAPVIEVAAGAFAVVSVQLRVKVHMPVFVAGPGFTLRRRNRAHRAAPRPACGHGTCGSSPYSAARR